MFVSKYNVLKKGRKLVLFCAYFWLFVCFFGTLPEANAEKNKEVYATEALRGLSAYFTFFSKQPEFLQLLSEPESQTFRLIRNLLIEYERARHPEGGGFIKPFPLQVSFSSDQTMFKLSPDEPARSAITSEEKLSPVIFNSLRLNAPDTKFLDVVQIMIHEVGHKLGEQKNQGAVDSLAVKIRLQLENFYKEKKSNQGHSIQFLALPVESQRIKSAADANLTEFHLFIETATELYRVAYDIYSHFRGRINTVPFVGHPRGIGNILLNQTYTLRDIINTTDGPRNLDLKLIFEIQSRLMFLDPYATLTPGPSDGNAQTLYPNHHQTDLVPPQTRIVEAPIDAIRMGMDENAAFNFFDFESHAWSYALITQEDAPNIKAYINQETEPSYQLNIELEGDQSFFNGLEVISIEVSSQTKPKYSYLIDGQMTTPGHYSFDIPKEMIPQQGGKIDQIIINQLSYLPLPEVIFLKPAFTKKEPVKLKVGAIDLINNESRIPYDRTKKIILEKAPIFLSLPVNFAPDQVRLRWLKGTEIELSTKDGESLPVGRFTSVVEETVDKSHFSITPNESDEDLPYNLQIQSHGVTKGHLAPIIKKDYFVQKDNGLRELKEVLLVSKDGRMIHWVLSNTETIYNAEYLKVPACQPILTH